MRTYPGYIEKVRIQSQEDSLIAKIEEAIARTGFEIITTLVIMAGSFGTISLPAAIFNHGISQTVRGLLTATTGV